MGRLLPDQSADPEVWSSQEKFHAVLETAGLSEAERAEYCRQYPLSRADPVLEGELCGRQRPE